MHSCARNDKFSIIKIKVALSSQTKKLQNRTRISIQIAMSILYIFIINIYLVANLGARC